MDKIKNEKIKSIVGKYKQINNDDHLDRFLTRKKFD